MKDRNQTFLLKTLCSYIMLFASASCSSDGSDSNGTPPPTSTVTVEVCPSYLEECDGRCTDTNNDHSHCGACSTACDDGQACVDATCTATPTSCPESQTRCDDKCIDPKTDPVFCGASGDCEGDKAGTTCASGEKCNGAGECELSCQSGLIDCNGSCVNPLTDNAYCGATSDCQGANAGATCAAGHVCNGSGSCALSCQSGLIDCEGTCVDPMNNDAYCGASADCKGANVGTMCVKPEQCIGYGSCGPVCKASELACSGACVDPMVDMDYCGATADCAGPNVGATCSDIEECAQGSCKKLAIACTIVNNAGGCTQGAIEQIILAKNLTAQQCHDQCEKEMPLKGMTTGCWIIASNTTCYCRNGVFSLGGTRPGGSCIKP